MAHHEINPRPEPENGASGKNGAPAQHHPVRVRNSTQGFTLIETLIALVILSVGLLALSKMSVTYVRAATTSHHLSEAAVLAREKMEELRGYGTSERGDHYSVFDFEYLTSTDTCFTTILDPPAGYPGSTEKYVPGLLAGNRMGSGACAGVVGAPLNTTMGNTYEVLYDDGAVLFPASGPVPVFRDAAANDGVWTGADRVFLNTVSSAGSGFFVTRLWTVEPLATPSPANPAVNETNYARVAVESHWTDPFGQQHQLRVESLVHRRQ